MPEQEFQVIFKSMVLGSNSFMKTRNVLRCLFCNHEWFEHITDNTLGLRFKCCGCKRLSSVPGLIRYWTKMDVYDV